MKKWIETFVDCHGHIFLLSNDQSILEVAAKAICKYAENSYPSTSLGEVNIQPFHSEALKKVNHQPFPDGLVRLDDYLSRNDKIANPEVAREWTIGNMFHQCHYYYEHAKQILDQNYAYSLNLDLILPSIVKTILDISHRYSGTSIANTLNCHGGALVASGIFPMTECYEEPIDCKRIPEGVHSIPIEAIIPGDIITLVSDTRDYDHSIVYLTDELCISINGRNRPMGIYAIKEVLNGYIPNIQYHSLKDLANVARCYRKSACLQYYESTFDMIREYYFLQASLCLCVTHPVCEAMSDRLKTLSCLLMIEGLSTNIPEKWYKKIQHSLLTAGPSSIYETMEKILDTQNTYPITKTQTIEMLKNPDDWSPPEIATLTTSHRFFTPTKDKMSSYIQGAVVVSTVIGLGIFLSS